MNNYKKNKKFIYCFLIGLILSFISFSSINIFLFQTDSKNIYNNSTISFENRNKNILKDSWYLHYMTYPSRSLSINEVKNEINYNLFSKIIDITIKYNINNNLDAQYFSKDNKYCPPTSREEIENDLLESISVISTNKHKELLQAFTRHSLYLRFTNNGKTIDYHRNFKYIITEDTSLDLSKENLDLKFEIGKNLLDDYSPRII